MTRALGGGNPAATLYDEDGNPVTVIQNEDGEWRIAVDAQISGGPDGPPELLGKMVITDEVRDARVLENGVRALAIRDEEVVDQLKKIGKELRKIRLLLELGQDTEVGDIDIEEDL
jgi:hypothetical protein